MPKEKKKSFFRFSRGIVLLTAFLCALSVIIILNISGFLTSPDPFAKIVNILIAPGNFLFDDILGVQLFWVRETMSWVVQFFYSFFLACLLRRLMKVKVRF